MPATLDHVEGRIGRVASLTEEGRTAEATDLAAEVTAMIQSLRGKGSVSSKRRLTRELARALEGVRQVEPPSVLAVGGVSSLVATGAQLVADGIRAARPAAHIAKDVCQVQISMHLLLQDKNGNPDLRAGTQAAKDANAALFDRAEGMLPRTPEMHTAMQRLGRSVHNVKRDVRAEFLRSLDREGANLEPFRAILREAPKGLKPSEALSVYYDVPLRTRTDIGTEDYRARTGAKGSTPEEKARLLTRRLRRDLGSVSPDDLTTLPPAVRAEVREGLEDANRSVRLLLAAVL